MTELKMMTRMTLAEKLDLRHPVPVLAWQVVNIQTGMTTQLGNMAAQIANLSQQVTRSNRANQTVTP